MPLLLTVSCFNKIQIGFTFLVPAYLDKGLLNGCVCVCGLICLLWTDDRKRWSYMWYRKFNVIVVLGPY